MDASVGLEVAVPDSSYILQDSCPGWFRLPMVEDGSAGSGASRGRTIGEYVCANCKCDLHEGRRFSFHGPAGQVLKCLLCSLYHWPLLKRSLLTALVVGTGLTLLNQGDEVLLGSWPSPLYWKVPLTYCVPFFVASWGALTNSRR